MLPKYDGFEVCRQIRDFSDVPVIMLTAKGEDMDKILGLEYGADDYITKPFNILEVKARMKAIMRRVAKKDGMSASGKVVVKGDLKIDCESRRVFSGDRELNLTAKEFDLLELLAMNPNKVYSRESLLNIVWGYEYPGDAHEQDHRAPKTLTIRQNRTETELPYDSIYYLESDLRKINVYGDVAHQPLCSYYGKLNELPQALFENGFLRVGRSAVVNMKYIRQISSYMVTLRNGVKLGVSRNGYAEIRSTYLEWKGQFGDD